MIEIIIGAVIMLVGILIGFGMGRVTNTENSS